MKTMTSRVRVDAHHHCWTRGLARTLAGSGAPAALTRRFSNPGFSSLLQDSGFDGGIAVQAVPSPAETDALLRLAKRIPSILGVVGWIDFNDRRSIDTVDEWMASSRYLVGLRPMVQSVRDTRWIGSARVAWAAKAMQERGLVFEALGYTQHASAFLRFMDRKHDLKVVIDHALKPQFGAADFKAWATAMHDLATASSAACKVSGLVSEAGPGVTAKMLQPYIDYLLEVFGPARLLWGSNWPVDAMVVPYGSWAEMSCRLFAGLGAADRDLVFGGNAVRVYGLSAAVLRARRAARNEVTP